MKHNKLQGRQIGSVMFILPSIKKGQPISFCALKTRNWPSPTMSSFLILIGAENRRHQTI